MIDDLADEVSSLIAAPPCFSAPFHDADGSGVDFGLADEVGPHLAALPCFSLPLYEVDVGFEMDFEAIDIDGLSAVSDSEWSVVTSAETSWAVQTSEACGLAPWPDTSSDEAIARALQQQERGPNPRWIASFPARGGPRSAGFTSAPSVSLAVKEGLVDRLGVCIVCSESVATVLMEPCGHLALCGTCHGAWAGLQRTCVLCRTPGVGVHMLCAPGNASVVHDVDIRLADGGVTIPSLDPSHEEHEPEKARSLKLALRRGMRDLTRQGRTRCRHGGNREDGSSPSPSTRAGGLYAKRAREAAAARQWAQYDNRLASWKSAKAALRHAQRTGSGLESTRNLIAMWRRDTSSVLPWGLSWRLYNESVLHQDQANAALGLGRRLHKVLAFARPDFEPRSCHSIRPLRQHPRYTASSHDTRGFVRKEKEKLQRTTAQAAQERREWRLARIQQEVEARAAVAKVVEVAAAVAGSPTLCLGCGEAEACMMALPCRCRSLCSSCWHAAPEGTQRRRICGRCGAGCKISLCVHRP